MPPAERARRPKAAAIMLPLLLVMDAVGLKALLAPKVVAGIVGALTLLFLAQRLVFPPRADAAAPPRCFLTGTKLPWDGLKH